jgi:hypothetical protein
MRNTLDDDTVSAADSQRTPAAAAGFTAWVPIHLRDSVITRALWLYGLYSILSNAGYLTAYYLLPEGSLRGSPWVAPGAAIAGQQRFWIHLGLTLLINVAVLLFSVALNLLVVRGIPQGYLMVVSIGLMSGLVAGSNSFAASDLTTYTAREGMALGLSIGGLEQAAMVLAVAATVRLGVYHYRTWYRLREKATKVGLVRAVRLTSGEWATLVVALLLLVVAAHRETLMFFGAA